MFDISKIMSALPDLKTAFAEGVATQKQTNNLLTQLLQAQQETVALQRQILATLKTQEQSCLIPIPARPERPARKQ
jgi:hypothetical protein